MTGSCMRFAVVGAAHRFLLRALPLRLPHSQSALNEFLLAVNENRLSPPELDAILISCLHVLDRYVRRLPSLVDHYLDLNEGPGDRCQLQRFERCVIDALRFRGVGDHGVQMAMDFIARSFAEPTLRPAYVSARAGRPLRQLTAAFRRQVGLTVTGYVREVRLAQAASLLLTSLLTVKEVWSAVGYNYASNFDHDFRRRYGTSPTTFRASGVRPWIRAETARPNSNLSDDVHRKGGRGTILLVDDDEVNTVVLGRFLSLEGYSVAVCASGVDFVTKLDHVSPRAVLLDYRLPDMSGLDCLRILRAGQCGTVPRVAILTADFDIYEREEEVKQLNATIVSKLSSLEDLKQLVDRLMT